MGLGPWSLGVLFAIVGWILATGTKHQWVRLVDILLYGPFLVYLSLHTTYTFSLVERIFLLFLGTTTVTYNLRNFLAIL